MSQKKKIRKNHRTEAVVAASGTVAGAAIGSVAGPVGVVAGAVVGTVIGATAGNVLEHEAEREHQHDEKLDEDIGVFDGQMGAAPPDAPRARIGAFSAASAGSGRPSRPPAEGPIPEPDER